MPGGTSWLGMMVSQEWVRLVIWAEWKIFFLPTNQKAIIMPKRKVDQRMVLE